MVKNSNYMKKGMVIFLLSTIEIFLFSSCCRNLQVIFIGRFIHVLLILSVSTMILGRKTQHFLYYTGIFLNYLLIIPMYINWHTGIDHYLIILYQIPILLNYYTKVSHLPFYRLSRIIKHCNILIDNLLTSRK